MGKYLPTAFAQLEFAWKLFAHAQDGKINIEELDQGTTYMEGGMMIVLRDRTFDSYDDLVIACENNVLIAFGAAVITLNRAREEQGLLLPDPITTELEQFISITYQIRNAFAHDIAEPRWNMRNSRYSRRYDFGGISVDLSRIKNDAPFTYADIGGPDTIFRMGDYFKDVVLGQ